MQLVAKNLGAGVEELEAPMAGGKADLETLGLDRTSPGCAKPNGMEQQINEAVTAGTITQSEADGLLTSLNRSNRHGHAHCAFNNLGAWWSSP